MNPLYLAIDQGTQSSRALLFDHSGRLVKSHRQKISIHRVALDQVEQDGEAILNSVLTSLELLLDDLSAEEKNSITACGICTQRSSVIACDRSGNPLSPVISWQDTRTADWLQTLSESTSEIQKISGLPLSPHYGASKMAWLQSQQALGDDFVLLPLASYLLFHLSSRKKFVVDHANAQRTQLMDIHSLDWSDVLLDYFKISRSNLPQCAAIESNFGSLLDLNIPITAVSGDQNAAIFGAGDLESDTALMNLGSGAFVMAFTESSEHSGALLTTIAASKNQSTEFVVEGTVNGAGNALKWATNKWQLGDLKKQLPRWLGTVKEPPVFINSIGGIGSPWWLSDVSPHFVAVSQTVLSTATATEDKKASHAVAVIESIIFLLMDNLSVIHRNRTIHRVHVSGGLSNLDDLCQKLADLTQLPVSRIENVEATGRGVAWLAAGRPQGWSASVSASFQPGNNERLYQRYQIFHSRIEALSKK